MKIANPNPPYCSSCFAQKPKQTHIDFEAYWDGPIIEGKSFKQPIDDLIVCEDCVKSAAQLVGLGDVGKMFEQRKELLSELKELREYKKNTEEKLELINAI